MTTAQEWGEWVARWKASGWTAPEFAAKHGLSSRKLYDWFYRLRKTKGAASKASPQVTTSPVRLLRVVRGEGGSATNGSADSPNAIRLSMAGASVDIHAGFDEATLRRVLCVVKGLQEGGR
jgi:hypothetical protein